MDKILIYYDASKGKNLTKSKRKIRRRMRFRTQDIGIEDYTIALSATSFIDLHILILENKCCRPISLLLASYSFIGFSHILICEARVNLCRL